MKKFTLLSFIALATLSCSDDDQNFPAVSLQGKWSLKEIHSPMVRRVTTFDEGAITWNFNESKRELAIENPTDNQSSLDSGTYSYSIGIEENICDLALNIDRPEHDLDLGCITIDGQMLSISKAYVDGHIYIFKKVN